MAAALAVPTAFGGKTIEPPRPYCADFRLTDDCQAIWCDIEVQVDKKGRVWTKWDDHWYFLEGPDPRYHSFAKAKHQWIRTRPSQQGEEQVEV